jgi:hypothetical protein
MKRFRRAAALAAVLCLVVTGMAIGQAFDVSNNLFFRSAKPSVSYVGGLVFKDTANGQGQVLQGGVPTVNTCGTATITGSDSAGKVTITAGTPTSCTVNVAATWASTPVCIASNETTVNTLPVASASTTVLTLSRQSGLTGTTANFGTDVLSWVCIGRT